MRRFIFVPVLIFVLTINSFAYDIIGHRTVADIAYHQLNCKARHKVDKILGKQGLIYFSTWADDLRNDSAYVYSYNWHFQDLADNKSPQDLQRLWDNPLLEGEHLFYAIQTMITRLKTNKNDAEALKFLVHFVGDLHQPFHVGRPEDRGGNDIQTKWFGRTVRVHQLWDRELIDLQGYSYSEFSQYLQEKYAPQKKTFKKQTLIQSIEKVYVLRQQLYTYDYANMQAYGYNYIYRNNLEQMLYSAGIQLANILNDIY